MGYLLQSVREVMPVALLFSLSAVSLPAAEATLQAQLSAGYPNVIRWEIKPFGHQTPAADVTEPQVLLLGSRSAVRVGSHVYWYAVVGLQRVATAAAPISAGEILDSRLVLVTEADVIAAGCAGATSLEDVDGMRAKRPMHQHQVICQSALEPKPLVARGENVTIHYIGAGLSLTARGIAQGDGRMGETLLVRNPSSQGVFRAVVSAAHEVTIHE